MHHYYQVLREHCDAAAVVVERRKRGRDTMALVAAQRLLARYSARLYAWNMHIINHVRVGVGDVYDKNWADVDPFRDRV